MKNKYQETVTYLQRKRQSTEGNLKTIQMLKLSDMDSEAAMKLCSVKWRRKLYLHWVKSRVNFRRENENIKKIQRNILEYKHNIKNSQQGLRIEMKKDQLNLKKDQQKLFYLQKKEKQLIQKKKKNEKAPEI